MLAGLCLGQIWKIPLFFSKSVAFLPQTWYIVPVSYTHLDVYKRQANGGAAIPRGSPDAATVDDNFHSVVGAAAGADTGADLCAGVAGFQLKGSPVDLNFGGIEGAVILASACLLYTSK